MTVKYVCGANNVKPKEMKRMDVIKHIYRGRPEIFAWSRPRLCRQCYLYLTEPCPFCNGTKVPGKFRRRPNEY